MLVINCMAKVIFGRLANRKKKEVKGEKER